MKKTATSPHKPRRILLVNPNLNKSRMMPFFPPIGIGMLAEVLEQEKISYDIIDMMLGYSYYRLRKKISKTKPDVIGVTMNSLHYKRNYVLFSKIKRDFPKIKIFVGGPWVSIVTKQVLSDCTEIDFGCVCEGEETIVEFMKGIPHNKIKGLIYRDGDKIIQNEGRKPILSLDSLPFPKYKKFELNKYLHKRIGIVTSRGCPNQCIYCTVKKVNGYLFRIRSAESIVSELEYWYDKGIRQFSILDDNFVQVRSRVHHICDEIEKRNLTGMSLCCPNGIRADCVDYDTLKQMKEVGFDYLGIGVESGSNKVLKNMKKGETVETIENAIKNALSLGFVVDLFFVVGTPGETWKDIHKSARIVRKYLIKANFFHLLPFPNSELYNYLQKNNLLVSKPEEYLNVSLLDGNAPVYRTRQMSIKERQRAYNMLLKVAADSRRRLLIKKYGGVRGKIYSYLLPKTGSLMWYTFRLSPWLYRALNAVYGFFMYKLFNIEQYHQT